MIGVLSYVALGFFAGFWGGAFLGFLQEWSWTAYVITVLSLVGAVAITVMAIGPSEFTTSVNWPFQLGIFLGAIVGSFGGGIMWDHWPTAQRRNA